MHKHVLLAQHPTSRHAAATHTNQWISHDDKWSWMCRRV